MSRTDTPEGRRLDFALVIDEFHNFTADSFVSILAEARKYRLSLALSHQYVDQLPLEIRKAVFGNAGTLIAFRVATPTPTYWPTNSARSFRPRTSPISSGARSWSSCSRTAPLAPPSAGQPFHRSNPATAGATDSPGTRAHDSQPRGLPLKTDSTAGCVCIHQSARKRPPLLFVERVDVVRHQFGCHPQVQQVVDPSPAQIQSH